jgi:hypothetical protein
VVSASVVKLLFTFFNGWVFLSCKIVANFQTLPKRPAIVFQVNSFHELESHHVDFKAFNYYPELILMLKVQVTVKEMTAG